MASRDGLSQPVTAAKADHPLRRVRRRRGLTTTALADLARLSQSFISMVETGQRPLRRRDHINALAAVLLILVWDASPLPPVLVNTSDDEENGRGLLLVDTLSARWGHFLHHGGGRVVFALIEDTT